MNAVYTKEIKILTSERSHFSCGVILQEKNYFGLKNSEPIETSDMQVKIIHLIYISMSYILVLFILSNTKLFENSLLLTPDDCI